MSLSHSSPYNVAALGALDALAVPSQRVIVSSILHAGLTLSVIAAFQVADLDPEGWIKAPRGWQPLPDRTLAEIRLWQAASTGSRRLLPHWTRSQLDALLDQISNNSGVPFSVERAHATLARALLQTTEDGRWLHAILGEDVTSAPLPLEAIFPFSIPNFESRSDELALRARRFLNRAAMVL